jgi:hypothetical protein
MSGAPGAATIMLRNLFLAGLTALSLAALASSAQAGGGRGSASSRNKSESAPQAGATAADTERPTAGIAPANKAKVKRTGKAVRRPGATRITRRVQAAVVNHSLLRPSWTIADLNPMPALLDLDDTAKNLRRATAEIARLMTR